MSSTGPLDALMAQLELDFRGAGPIQLLGAERIARRRLAATQTKCVVTRLENNVLALPMDHVVEILTPPAITPLPNVPDWLLGVANLRGEIVSVCDFRQYLGYPSVSRDTRQRVVVVRSREEEMSTGLLVDRVDGIRGLSVDTGTAPRIDLPASVQELVRSPILQDGTIYLMLDMERLLTSSMLRQLGTA
jgi:chemotaxis signal transduction protein